MIETLEYYWRHKLVYPVLRLIFHNKRKETPIDLQTINSVLILRYDRIGDMIVTTPIFRTLKQSNPELKIGVIASESNAEIIRNNPFVDSIYILHSNRLKLIAEIFKARKQRYDVVLNLIFNRTTTGGLLANFISPSGIKIGQGDEKYQFYFNRLLRLCRTDRRMIDTLACIIKEVFNLTLHADQLSYEIFVNETTKKDVIAYLRKNNLVPRNQPESGKSHYIVFNLSANDSVRRISPEQAYAIGNHLSVKTGFRTVLLHAPLDSTMLTVKQNLVSNTGCHSFPDHGNASLLEIASIIDGAFAVVTPDTSIIHFASAARTPVIGFYTKMQDVHEWLPHRVKNRLLMSAEHQPTSSIPIPQMINAIDEFIQELEKDSVKK